MDCGSTNQSWYSPWVKKTELKIQGGQEGYSYMGTVPERSHTKSSRELYKMPSSLIKWVLIIIIMWGKYEVGKEPPENSSSNKDLTKMKSTLLRKRLQRKVRHYFSHDWEEPEKKIKWRMMNLQKRTSSNIQREGGISEHSTKTFL